MLVSSSSALGIKTCLYKGFLTAEGTKCSPERKEQNLLHLPSTPTLQRNNASQRSWQLALGRWQEQCCSLPRKRKLELSASRSSTIILPTTSRQTRSPHRVTGSQCHPPSSPFCSCHLVPVATGWWSRREGRLVTHSC